MPDTSRSLENQSTSCKTPRRRPRGARDWKGESSSTAGESGRAVFTLPNPQTTGWSRSLQKQASSHQSLVCPQSLHAQPTTASPKSLPRQSANSRRMMSHGKADQINWPGSQGVTLFQTSGSQRTSGVRSVAVPKTRRGRRCDAVESFRRAMSHNAQDPARGRR
jgi:hypothetical protein